MEIFAHPLITGEYIIYVLDPNNRPYVAKLTNNRDEISTIASKFSKKYDIDKAEYVEDYSLTSEKPRWKIII